jgi:hypothetical protein
MSDIDVNRTYIARSRQVAARMLGGEMMIMSARDSTLFSLNEVASVIWKAADGVTPLTEIVEGRVCAEFDVAPDVALRDAGELVEALAQHGILQVSNAPLIEAAP